MNTVPPLPAKNTKANVPAIFEKQKQAGNKNLNSKSENIGPKTYYFESII
jgi:hypothetical protein